MKSLGTPVAVMCLTLLMAGCYFFESDKSYSTVSTSFVCDEIADLPSIGIHPDDQTVFEGQDAEFRVAAGGRPPLSYRWYLSQAPAYREFQTGENSPVLRIPSVTMADNQARIRVDVAGCQRVVRSADATLTVLPALEITRQPQSVTVASGQPATFDVEASGTPPLSYQWRRGGGNIAGATGPSLTLPATDDGDDGAVFSVLVTNSASPPASVLSDGAELTVQAPLSVLSATVSPSLPAGVPAHATGVTRFILAELGLADARLRVSCLRSGSLLCEEISFDTSPPLGDPLLAEVTLPFTMLANTYRFGLRATLGPAVSEERVQNVELSPGTGVLRCEETTNGEPGDSERRIFGLQLQTAGGVPIANADYHVYDRSTTGRGWNDYRTVGGADRAILIGFGAELDSGRNFQATAVERAGATPPAWAAREWGFGMPPSGSTLGCQSCNARLGGNCLIIPLGG